MIPIIDTIKIGSESRKSTKSIIQVDLDSVRATVLGKFYEGIIAQWLVEVEGYEFMDGKPYVPWSSIEEESIPNECINDFVEVLNKYKRNAKRKSLDGLFRKEQKYFLWEAKNWPKWNPGMQVERDQIYSIFKKSPWIFTKTATHRQSEIQIDCILFSWWSEFSGYKEFEHEMANITGKDFKLYFTSSIIQDCKDKEYDWFFALINEQRNNLDRFFIELSGR